MKKYLLSIIILIAFNPLAKTQTTHTIETSGLAFSPDEITISVGDTIFFNVSASHPVLEVSEDTWNSNGTAALTNGFAFPSGSGKISFDEEGTHYYICEVHVSSGMKGKIIVSSTTGVEILNSNSVHIYPNPVKSSTINFELPDMNGQITVSIYDLTGRIKLQTDIPRKSTQFQIKDVNLNPGAYIIQLTAGNYNYTTQIIKQ